MEFLRNWPVTPERAVVDVVVNRNIDMVLLFAVMFVLP